MHLAGSVREYDDITLEEREWDGTFVSKGGRWEKRGRRVSLRS